MASDAGAAALEAVAWAAYDDRRFDRAAQAAAEGACAATDPLARARCLAAGGRIAHAAGDLGGAEQLLVEAREQSVGADRGTVEAWLGVLRAHQGRIDDAVQLLRPATDEASAADHPAATLDALLFTGYAHALDGRPAQALALFDRYSCEVERLQMPRFAGQAVNTSGWVLRNIGAGDDALELHQSALQTSATSSATVEVAIAAMQDLAEHALDRGDVDRAARRVDEAESSLVGDLVFGWRLKMRLRLLQGRVALARGDGESALMFASVLAQRADAAGVPRYASVARLLAHRATAALGRPVDLTQVAADLDAVDRSVAIESWWWTAMVAADLHVPAWVDRAADRVTGLARESGERGAAFRAHAAPRLDAWRAAAG